MSQKLHELGAEYEDLRYEIGQIEADIEKLAGKRERLNELAVLIKQYVSEPSPVATGAASESRPDIIDAVSDYVQPNGVFSEPE